MKSITEEIELGFRIPCGPFKISADSVCRKSLRDDMDRLLDRLTEEVNPSVNLPDSELESPEDPEEEKRKMIERGKVRAEVALELKKYREELQGNSKMLQDISGKIEPY